MFRKTHKLGPKSCGFEPDIPRVRCALCDSHRPAGERWRLRNSVLRSPRVQQAAAKMSEMLQTLR